MLQHRAYPRTVVGIVAVIALACISETRSTADEPAVRERAAETAEKAKPAMIGTETGQVRDDNGLKMKLVWCPKGFIKMEQVEQFENHDPIITPRNVFLTQGYWMAKYEVTQAEWKQVMTTEPWKGRTHTQEGGDFPVTYINWDDAMEFCRKLTDQERTMGRLPDRWEYTLPTEAQWERACRARTETQFSFGDDETTLGEYAWFLNNAWAVEERYPHRVGQKKPNPWGLHDMHGNVSEWCRDWSALKLPGGRSPEVTDKGKGRVVRGGSWHDPAERCRSAYRNWLEPELLAYNLTGFRVVLSVIEPLK